MKRYCILNIVICEIDYNSIRIPLLKTYWKTKKILPVIRVDIGLLMILTAFMVYAFRHNLYREAAS